jgi:hypothetical protein
VEPLVDDKADLILAPPADLAVAEEAGHDLSLPAAVWSAQKKSWVASEASR